MSNSYYADYLGKSLQNIIMARQALDAYNKTNIKDLKNGAAYHTQQAIELIIKYQIYNNTNYNNNGTNTNQILIHDINKLIKKYCKPYNIKVPEKIVRNAKMYSTWEAESRYSLKFSVRIDYICSALDTAENWLIQIKPIYRAKIVDVKRKLNIL